MIRGAISKLSMKHESYAWLTANASSQILFQKHVIKPFSFIYFFMMDHNGLKMFFVFFKLKFLVSLIIVKKIIVSCVFFRSSASLEELGLKTLSRLGECSNFMLDILLNALIYFCSVFIV